MKTIKLNLLMVCCSLAVSVQANFFTLPVSVGSIEGAYVEHVDGDTVSISVGFGEVNGVYWENDLSVSLDLVVPSGRGYYIHIYRLFSEFFSGADFCRFYE